MRFIIEANLPSDSFGLESVLLLDHVRSVEFDCTVSARLGAMPHFWIWGSDFDGVEAALETNSAVGEVTVVERLESGRLYRAPWPATADLLDAVRAGDGTLRSGTGTEQWAFEFGFGSRADLAAFSERCSRANIDMQIGRIWSLDPPVADDYGLTTIQRETLLAAERSGYFEEPRAITMEGLARELDRSSAAVSGLLRRGVSTLIRNALDDPDSESL